MSLQLGLAQLASDLPQQQNADSRHHAEIQHVAQSELASGLSEAVEAQNWRWAILMRMPNLADAHPPDVFSSTKAPATSLR